MSWSCYGIFGIMYSQFGVGPPLYLCCSSHVPLLYIFCPPVVPLMCSCSASLVPLVPLLLFISSSNLLLSFTWGHWEDLKMPYGGTLMSRFCSSKPYKITLFKRNSHPREVFWCKTPWQSRLSKLIYNVKLFLLLGGRAIMWGWEYRGSMVSFRPQTLPHPTSGAWYDFETRFDNLNLDLDIHWNCFLLLHSCSSTAS